MILVPQSAAWFILPLVQLACCEPDLYVSGNQVPLATVENGTATGCHQACLQLRSIDRSDLLTHYPDLPADFQTGFFFTLQQRERTPTCVVQPQSAEAVEVVVNSVREHQCSFAVKSGGHSIAPGTSNLNNGLLLDLRFLNQIQVSKDRQTVSLGPGNKWGPVYRELESQGLLVVGGRVSSVGVGGFTMGGGLSFLSRRHGWAIDNVRNFQVVLPNGTLTNVNLKSSPDLYFALRGGGSNFGIVTRFDVEAHDHDLLWGGTTANIMIDLADRSKALGLADRFDWSLQSAATVASRWIQDAAIGFGFGAHSADVTNAFVGLTSESQTDPSTHAYVFMAWMPSMKAYIVGGTYVYCQPVEHPPPLLNLSSVPSLFSKNRLGRMSEFADEVETFNIYDSRHYWKTATFKVNAEFISKLWDILLVEGNEVRNLVPDAVWGINLQHLTKDEIALFSKHGGNAFGIEVEDGPLFFASITPSWTLRKHDEIMINMADSIIAKAVELAKEMGLYHPFIYPNYAASGQDVFAGYSPKTLNRLKTIQERHDPGRAFASLQPAHFRL